MNADRERALLALSRRELLRRGGVAVVTVGVGPALLAACGGEDEEPTATGAPAEQAQIGGPVDYLSWEGYDLPNETKAWRQENDVTFRTTYIGTHDDIQAKLKAGAATSYDLITYYQGFIDLYRTLEILTPLDESKIPNLANMYPFFREGEASDRFWKVDGERWGVPWTWGTTTLDYRADQIDPPESWFDLLEPEFKGKVGWVPDASGAFTLAGHILDFDVPNYTPDQFEECKTLLRRFREQIRGFAPSFGDLANQFSTGEIVASFIGWAAVGVFAGPDANVESTIPSEGSYSFCDSYAIPPTADNVETVHAFINEALSAEVQAMQAESLSAGVVTPDAVPLMPENVAALYPYDTLEEHLTIAPFYPLAPVEEEGEIVTREEWLAEWEKIQAGD
jgi:spermidine/putrescine transport system substrate-binding protein